MNHIRRSLVPAAGLAAVLVAAVGCASAPADPVDELLEDSARRLASQCYWQHDGARAIYGGMQVFVACQRWADRQVQVSLPARR